MKSDTRLAVAMDAIASSFGRITGIINTGATGSGAPRRFEFMLRTDF